MAWIRTLWSSILDSPTQEISDRDAPTEEVSIEELMTSVEPLLEEYYTKDVLSLCNITNKSLSCMKDSGIISPVPRTCPIRYTFITLMEVSIANAFRSYHIPNKVIGMYLNLVRRFMEELEGLDYWDLFEIAIEDGEYIYVSLADDQYHVDQGLRIIDSLSSTNGVIRLKPEEYDYVERSRITVQILTIYEDLEKRAKEYVRKRMAERQQTKELSI